MRRKYLGFTIVELMVVISIIGILATLVSVNVIGAKKRARDTQRISDMSSLSGALELYRMDNGTYKIPNIGNHNNGWGWVNFNSGLATCPAPVGTPSVDIDSSTGCAIYGYGASSIAKALVDEGYLPSVISDPSGKVTSRSGNENSAYMLYVYSKNKTGTTYNLGGDFYYFYARLENPDTGGVNKIIAPNNPVPTHHTSGPDANTNYGMNFFMSLHGKP